MGDSETVILRNNVSIAAVELLQTVSPALVAVGCLYAMLWAYGSVVPVYFHVLAVVVGLLALLLMPHLSRSGSAQIFAGPLTLAVRVFTRWAILLGILLAIGYAVKFTEEYSRRVVLTWAVLTPTLVIGATLVLDFVMRRLLAHPLNARKVVFAGSNEVSQALASHLARSPELCMTVEGFFDDRSLDRLQLNGGMVSLLGKLSALASYVKTRGVQVVFIALPARHIRRVTELLDNLRDTTASIYYVPDICIADLIQARSGEISGIPVISMCETPFSGSRGVSKRMTDVVVAGLILLLALPLMTIIALAIRVTSPGPVIFRQRRYGLNGEEIIVYKFRTMTVLEDGFSIAQATRDDPRITNVGRILRRYSLDELPQLINVLQGRMSLVGPRPHAVAHNEMYRKLIKGYMVRHKVRPGITGLAQVNGLRGETRSVEQMVVRVQYDLQYLRSWSIALDLKILAKTVICVWHDSKAY
jgi:putative colanic acid biosynthesis UDP-glucose lipid carrier transferase